MSSEPTPPFERSTRSRWRPRPWLRRLCNFLLVAATLWVLERAHGEWAWQRYRAKAAARGAKLYLTDFTPRPISDAENYAAISVFRRPVEADRDGRSYINPFILPPPKRDSKQNNSADQPLDMSRWQRGFVSAGWLSAPNDEPAVGVLIALARLDPQLQEVRAARGRAKAYWPLDWSKRLGTPAPFDIIKGVAGVFALRCKALLALGRSEEALDEWRHGIHCARAIRDRPTLAAGFARIAIWHTLSEAAQAGIAANKWNNEQLATLASEVGSYNWLEDLHLTVQSERGIHNSAMEDAIGQSGADLSIYLFDQPTAKSILALSILPRGWLRHNQVFQNRIFDIETSELNLKTGKFHQISDLRAEKLTLVKGGLIGLYLSPTKVAMSSNSMSSPFIRQQGRTSLFQLVCTLGRHRRYHGAYPDTLAELVPDSIERIPIDLIDGSPLRYRLDADGGCLVWSIGLDGHDSHGRENDNGNDIGDWVLRLPAPPK